MMDATSGAWTDYPSGAHEFTPIFSGVRVTRYLALCVVLCRSLFVPLSFFCWPLCCLYFFGLWIMITPLVSSNSSSSRFAFFCTAYFCLVCREKIYPLWVICKTKVYIKFNSWYQFHLKRDTQWNNKITGALKFN